jgi:hypothetical protein
VVRQACHERNQPLAVRPESVEELVQGFPMSFLPTNSFWFATQPDYCPWPVMHALSVVVGNSYTSFCREGLIDDSHVFHGYASYLKYLIRPSRPIAAAPAA